MNVTDPIADFLTSLRNGLRARHKSVEVPASKLKLQMATILRDEGYIAGFRLVEEGAGKRIEVRLKYGNNNEPIISSIQRVSRPGRRVYTASHKVPRVLGGMGINILTTPKGLMTGRTAKKENVGGEILCEIW
jgi:small subunit ribosomal protein S8